MGEFEDKKNDNKIKEYRILHKEYLDRRFTV